MTTFAAETYQNEFLAAGATRVDALVSVSATGTGNTATGRESAELVIIDVSGSMNFPRTKIKSAVAATCEAIDCIRDDVLFGVIAGDDDARLVYPGGDKLVPASPTTRQAAKDTVRKLKANGGTAIGQWLSLARYMVADRPDCISHAILLTDGENQNESPEELAEALAACEGSFQCDCRGVGADWVVSELRTDRVDVARHGRGDPCSGGPRRRLHRDHGTGDGAWHRQCRAACLDAGGRARRPGATGEPDARGPDRTAGRRERSRGRLSHRRMV